MARTTGKVGLFVLGFTMVVCGMLLFNDAESTLPVWARTMAAALFSIAGLASMASASKP